jgi:signal transduction histidine kinase
MITTSESYCRLSVSSYVEYYQDYKSGIGFYNFGKLVINLMSLDNNLMKIQIVDVNGKILFDSDEIEQGEYNENELGERFFENSKTIDRAGAFDSSLIINENENYIDIMQPYFDEWDRHDYSVRYIFSLTNLEQSKSEMYSTLFIYAGIFVLISSFLIYVLSYYLITNPIDNLMKGIKTMRQGNLGSEINVFSDDELGQLARAYNQMRKNLKKSQDSLKDYSENLEKLVTKRTEQLEDKTANLEKINKDLIKARKELNALNKNLERRIKERTTEVEQLLEQKDGFINQLSHDLKSPLNPLTILIPILQKTETDVKKKEILEVINRNVEYMRNIAVKTLVLAKLNSPKTKFTLEKLNLTEEVKRILKNKVTVFQEKDLEITNNISKKLIINADKLRFEELLNNLLENSVKYSKQKGNISINAEKEKNFVKVYIKDTGLGMTKEHIKHVFDEFYKVDESRHDFDSSGLGLNICKKIIEKHNGDIWIESKGLDKGTTVFFKLPLYNDKKKGKN